MTNYHPPRKSFYVNKHNYSNAVKFPQATNHYSVPTSSYSPYFGHGNLVPALIGPDQSASVSPIGHTVPQMAHQKIYRPAERLEVS